MTILRWFIFSVMIYFIYKETGLITVIAFSLFFLVTEFQADTNKKHLENEKLLLEDIGNVVKFLNKFCPIHIARSSHAKDKTRQNRFNSGSAEAS